MKLVPLAAGATAGALLVRALRRDRSRVPAASVPDTVRILSQVVLPTIAKGVLLRRPRVVALAERLDLDRRAVRCLERARERYGRGPLLLRLPLRSQAVVLAPSDVRRVLDGAPEPFAPASSEKQAALAHFEPKVVLASNEPERGERRRVNEIALAPDRPAHPSSERFLGIVREEVRPLLGIADGPRLLGWDEFRARWFRIVRRVVLGDAARDDADLIEMLDALRADANWAFLKPRRTWLRERMLERIRHYLRTAEPSSVAGIAARAATTPQAAPEHQVPQWLFAFDAAAIATFRALALLAAHPNRAEQARAEIEASDAARKSLPFLRACVLESLRLWPTTPMILRQTTRETDWETGTLPARSGLLIFVPYLHRSSTLPNADRFAPDEWLRAGAGVDVDGRARAEWPLVPFSAGPAMCPGRQLVLLLASNVLASLLEARDVRLTAPHRLDPDRPLPGTLNAFALRFVLEPRAAAA